MGPESCGTAYTASPPSVTAFQTPSGNCFARPGSMSPLMSASASADTSVGIFWYSACMMSGAPLPALIAVRSLVTAGSPPSCLLTVTWMSGWAVFQPSTTLSMFGAQVQNVSSTFSLAAAGVVAASVVVLLLVPPEHAAASSAVAATT